MYRFESLSLRYIGMRKRPLPEKAGMRLGERAGCKERETCLQVSDSLFCTICSGRGRCNSEYGQV